MSKLLKVSFGVGLVGCKREDVIEILDKEWDSCESQEEKDELCEQYYQDFQNQYLDGYWEIIED